MDNSYYTTMVSKYPWILAIVDWIEAKALEAARKGESGCYFDMKMLASMDQIVGWSIGDRCEVAGRVKDRETRVEVAIPKMSPLELRILYDKIKTIFPIVEISPESEYGVGKIYGVRWVTEKLT